MTTPTTRSSPAGCASGTATRSPSTASTSTCRARHRARPARAQRRRQEHRRPHPRDPDPSTRARPASPGFDVRTQHAQVRAAIGLVGQSAALDEVLHGRENLVMFGRLHGLATAAAQARAAELLDGVRPRRRRGPQGLDLLRRHASPPRHRRRPDHPARGALPRRADHRPRPARPRRGLGRRPPGGRAGHHGAAHHAVPRRGRPARRPDHRDGRRPGRSPRAPRPSSRPGSAATGCSSASPTGPTRPSRARPSPRRSAATSDSTRTRPRSSSRPVPRAAPTALLAVVRALDAAGHHVRPTSSCAEPTLDEVFLHLTGPPHHP